MAALALTAPAGGGDATAAGLAESGTATDEGPLAPAGGRDATAPDVGAGGVYELWFRLEAEIRSRRLDADLRAGGRLLMGGEPAPGGGLVLSLERVLETPWKLYWVDPAGPLGEEVKLATVVDLPDASWEALAAAREAADRLGQREYARWRAGDPAKPRFDGAFAFVVLGPAAGRFEVRLGARGELLAVENRLTDRWRSGPFDQWIGTWGPGTAAVEPTAKAPSGYWFWNQGETEPLAYEPHTYHALAAALELLRGALPAEAEPFHWMAPAVAARTVLETLAPKTRRRAPPEGPARLELSRASAEDSSQLFTGEWHDAATRLAAERSWTLSEGGITGRRARVELREAGDRLVVEVGFHRLADRMPVM